jgi:hypothetical protein
MTDTPRTAALWSRVGAMVVPLNEPVVLRRECAQIEMELRAEVEDLTTKNQGALDLAVEEHNRAERLEAEVERLRAAARQALEALEYIYTETTPEEDALIHAAIVALRAALKEPK